jgi:hypothetical protein
VGVAVPRVLALLTNISIYNNNNIYLLLTNRIDIREEYRIAVKTALINQWKQIKLLYIIYLITGHKN